MAHRPPVAFLSYARINDQHDRGKLSELCERLSAEVEVQSGEPFEIFQDRKDIAWGQAWQSRLEDSIDEATFLIPILTPSFFKSEWCRAELARFLANEERLGRGDLVLPLHYVDCRVLRDEARRADDELAAALSSRQMIDWRELRFEPIASGLVGKKLASMAIQVRDALDRVSAAPAAAPAPDPAPAQSFLGRSTFKAETESAATAPTHERADHVPTERTEIPTLIVDSMHRGDHATISEAVEAAAPGTRILIRPGLYEEALEIDKPLEIVGDGPRDDIIVQAFGADVILFRASMGRISNLTLRQTGGGEWYAVDISQGRLELEQCDISSRALACVGIHSGADPRLRGNRIHDSAQSGLVIYADGRGTLEENEISGNVLHGLAISDGAGPIIRNNQIHANVQSGVFVHGATVTLEANEIAANLGAGVVLAEGANGALRNNTIHYQDGGGIFAYDGAIGLIEDNQITANTLAGVELADGADPILSGNHIGEGESGGVLVRSEGLGTFEHNTIVGNANAGVITKSGGNPTMRFNKINGNLYEAIWVHEGGAGTFEHNDLTDNERGPWDVAKDCVELVHASENVEE